MIAGLILASTGFVANVAQNVDVQNGLKAMMSVIPVAIGVVSLIILLFYKLDEPTMKKIKATWMKGARRAKPALPPRNRSGSCQVRKSAGCISNYEQRAEYSH